MKRLVRALRAENGGRREVKLPDIDEARYASFLSQLAVLHGTVWAVAIDAGLHTHEGLTWHRDQQADKLLENVHRMHYASGRQGVINVATAVRSLPVQLYAQLMYQVEAFHDVIARAVTYYAQRQPATLGAMRWRLDRKDAVRQTKYEQTFRQVLPALLQTKSLIDPALMLTEGADYSHFRRFEYPESEVPTYLKDEYGIEVGASPANAGKIISDDFELVDSRNVCGVQVADLLASGLRRTLKGNFDDPERIAASLGALMVERGERKPPVRLLALGPALGGDEVSDHAATMLRLMARTCRPYLAKTPLVRSS